MSELMSGLAKSTSLEAGSRTFDAAVVVCQAVEKKS